MARVTVGQLSTMLGKIPGSGAPIVVDIGNAEHLYIKELLFLRTDVPTDHGKDAEVKMILKIICEKEEDAPPKSSS